MNGVQNENNCESRDDARDEYYGVICEYKNDRIIAVGGRGYLMQSKDDHGQWHRATRTCPDADKMTVLLMASGFRVLELLFQCAPFDPADVSDYIADGRIKRLRPETIASHEMLAEIQAKAEAAYFAPEACRARALERRRAAIKARKAANRNATGGTIH